MTFWEVVRVDLEGTLLQRSTCFSCSVARQLFDFECLKIGAGDGAAVYLREDGVVIDQVVAREPVGLSRELVFGGLESAERGA